MKFFKFELDRTSKKYTCPGCGNRTFVRYIDTETGELLPEKYGRCDREISCGYFSKPEGQSKTIRQHHAPPTEVSYIPFEILKSPLRGYEQNTFIQNLLKTSSPADVERIIS
ncbi:MAG: hypothetical protein EOM06_14670, partial [Sphingobacteriia bacterium]|nr:hypothetical protein [Sphingobacteriia bacterium]